MRLDVMRYGICLANCICRILIVKWEFHFTKFLNFIPSFSTQAVNYCSFCTKRKNDGMKLSKCLDIRLNIVYVLPTTINIDLNKNRRIQSIFVVFKTEYTLSRLPQCFVIKCKREQAGKGLRSSKRVSVRRIRSKIIGLIYYQSCLIQFSEQLFYVTMFGRIQLKTESVIQMC